MSGEVLVDVVGSTEWFFSELTLTAKATYGGTSIASCKFQGDSIKIYINKPNDSGFHSGLDHFRGSKKLSSRNLRTRYFNGGHEMEEVRSGGGKNRYFLWSRGKKEDNPLFVWFAME
ncbi:hypothetical protein A2U01_0000815 [Trifolium medium]|uniref:Uncharacterized protein n=1 Tax=Trifolium medium TaxID=97028 RepID=A0A392LYL1_9FABA|nr:hypothetical protein [Trifolium medium]